MLENKKEFDDAKEFAHQYYQLDKSNLTTVSMKSAIKFAQRFHQNQIDNAWKQFIKEEHKAAQELKEGNARLSLHQIISNQ